MHCCFFKQKTAYEMRISDWSSDVCSSDLLANLCPISRHWSHTPVTDTRTLPATKPQPSRWVQTDRASHEAWARLSASNPKAGALLHLLAARVGDNNAVVVSHKTLAELLGVRSITTI